jgi:hypothetical protein
MQAATYYRAKAERVRRMADALTNDDDRISLRQLAQDLDDVAIDLETKAVQIVAPDQLPQRNHPRP